MTRHNVLRVNVTLMAVSVQIHSCEMTWHITTPKRAWASSQRVGPITVELQCS